LIWFQAPSKVTAVSEVQPAVVDRRVRRTQKALKNAFVALVLERGYDQVSIEDITERADVARATFYAHYSQKEALLTSVFAEVSEDLYDLSEYGGPPSEVRPGALFAKAATMRDIYRVCLSGAGEGRARAAYTDAVRRIVERDFSYRVDALGVVPRLPVPVMSRAFAGAHVALLEAWLNGELEHTIDEMVSMQLHVLVLGLGWAHGIAAGDTNWVVLEPEAVPEPPDQPQVRAGPAGDRRVRRTERALKDALVALVLERGYEKVGIEDITELADVARATFYAHYPDKNALLAAVFTELADDVHDRLTLREGPWDAVRTVMVMRAYQHAAGLCDLYQVCLGGAGGGRARAAYMQAIARSVETNFTARLKALGTSPRVPVPFMARLFAGTHATLLESWLNGELDYPAEDMARMEVQFLAFGCAWALGVQAGDVSLVDMPVGLDPGDAAPGASPRGAED
jgi:AcrR family transcriptional regulator